MLETDLGVSSAFLGIETRTETKPEEDHLPGEEYLWAHINGVPVLVVPLLRL